MALPKERYYTYADIQAWEDNKRYELYDGQIVAQAAPSSVHQRISAALTAQFFNYLLGKKCEVYPAPFDVRLFEQDGDSPDDVNTVVQPDISVICDPAQTDSHGCKGAPDLVIEILSPSTQRADRVTKYKLYQQAGVKEYWIVDPAQRAVSVHTLEDGQYYAAVVYTVGTEVPVGILEDCRIDLRTVFPDNA